MKFPSALLVLLTLRLAFRRICKTKKKVRWGSAASGPTKGVDRAKYKLYMIFVLVA